MSRKSMFGLIALGLISVSSANAALCGDWCDGFRTNGLPTLHYQGGMVNQYSDGVMLSYQRPSHALHCGHYVTQTCMEK